MENLTKQQINFLRNYAHSLNAVKSALDGGYSENVAHVQARSLLSRKKYQHALNSIIEREVDKLEIPKAFILKKYLQVIDWASGVDEKSVLNARGGHVAGMPAGKNGFDGFDGFVGVNLENENPQSGAGVGFLDKENKRAPEALVRDFCAPRDPSLLLKALEGLQRFLERAKEEPKNEEQSAFWQIDNVDCSKI